MLIIKNKIELDKHKKVEGAKIIYEFDEDVVFDFKLIANMNSDEVKEEDLKKCKTNMEKIMLVLDEKALSYNVFKGESMTFNKDVDWIQELDLKGDLKCDGEIHGHHFQVGGNVEANKLVCQRVEGKDVSAKHIVCKKLDCKNLNASYAKIDKLYSEGEINCEMLDIDHISSCDKLKADMMKINGSMLYNVSAKGENLAVQRKTRKR